MHVYCTRRVGRFCCEIMRKTSEPNYNVLLTTNQTRRRSPTHISQSPARPPGRLVLLNTQT